MVTMQAIAIGEQNLTNGLVYRYVQVITNTIASITIGYFISTNRLRDESWKA